MKLIQLLIEKIKNFFNKKQVVVEVKVAQPKPATPKKEVKDDSTSPVVIGEEAFKKSQLESLAAAQEVKVTAPVVDETPSVVEPSAPVAEKAPKKARKKYYRKHKPKAN